MPGLLAGAVQEVDERLDQLELLDLRGAHLDALSAELLVVEEALVDLVLQHRRVLIAKGLQGGVEIIENLLLNFIFSANSLF